MAEKATTVWDDFQNVERVLASISDDLHFLNRLCDLLLGSLVRDSLPDGDIALYLQLRRTLNRLQKEALRQAMLLLNLREREEVLPRRGGIAGCPTTRRGSGPTKRRRQPYPLGP